MISFDSRLNKRSTRSVSTEGADSKVEVNERVLAEAGKSSTGQAQGESDPSAWTADTPAEIQVIIRFTSTREEPILIGQHPHSSASNSCLRAFATSLI